jgi:hypothetical protein
MTPNTKLSLTMLLTAVMLVSFVPMSKADERVTDNISVDVTEQTNNLITFNMNLDGSTYGIITVNCNKKLYAYNDMNGNGSGTSSLLTYGGFNTADTDEIKALRYVCGVKI